MSLESRPPDYFEMAGEAAASIRERVFEMPQTAVVLGSGLGSIADRLVDRIVIPCSTIPHYPEPTVKGHAGNLVVGRIVDGGIGVIMLQGRFHYYEGHDLETVTFPIRVLSRLGVRTLILTAATGGIRPDLGPGSLICLADHLNLLGVNPLRGPNDTRFGLRFPDMTEVYSKRLRTMATEVATEQDLQLGEGIYACLSGPSYETPAEIRMLQLLGADVVGMSTVPEAIVARHSGMEVLAFALVTNAAAGVTGQMIDHQEVIDEGMRAEPALERIMNRVIMRLAREKPAQ